MISLPMRTFALVLACLACAGHGDRVQMASEQAQDGSYAEYQYLHNVGNATSSSHPFAEMEMSRSNSRAGVPRPPQVLAVLLLALSNQAAAFAPGSLRSFAGHGQAVTARGRRPIPGQGHGLAVGNPGDWTSSTLGSGLRLRLRNPPQMSKRARKREKEQARKQREKEQRRKRESLTPEEREVGKGKYSESLTAEQRKKREEDERRMKEEVETLADENLAKVRQILFATRGKKVKTLEDYSTSDKTLEGAMQTLLTRANYPFELAVGNGVQYDPAYPGTAVIRLSSVLKRVRDLPRLSGPWVEVRRQLLAAGGLKDDQSTSHAFNDDSHCDLTTMVVGVLQLGATRTFKDNTVRLIDGASLPELGPGGSWATRTNGAHLTPPSDAAHVEFHARVAFKLVWVPPDFTTFVLVDDEGRFLKSGTPSGRYGDLPSFSSRTRTYDLVQGSKYASIADLMAAGQLPLRRNNNFPQDKPDTPAETTALADASAAASASARISTENSNE